LSIGDTFQKTSDLLSLPEQSSAASGGNPIRPPNDSLVPPSTPIISNFSYLEMTYQFRPNEMVGGKGTVSGLWYPDRSNLPGFFDSTAQAGELFYAHRVSGRHYIGATYGFQNLMSHPGTIETQTQSTLLFYTLNLPPTLAVSVFAGPEHSDTHGGGSLPLTAWSPAAGASVGWRGAHASFTASYAQRISAGSGLAGAVRNNRVDSSIRWQLAKAFTTALGASYSTSNLLDSQPSATGGSGGHSWSGIASLQHPLGERLIAQVGYTRLHQSYSSVAAISEAPNRNNVWISLSYQFERPLGR